MIPIDRVANWMSACPVSIGPHDLAPVAHRLFVEHGIRHLPVLEDGKLVGVLCERDLQVAELFGGTRTLTVEVVMSATPYVVSPTAALSEVAACMVEKLEDAAVVVDRGRVVGVFTSTDALRALAATAPRRAVMTKKKEKRHEAH